MHSQSSPRRPRKSRFSLLPLVYGALLKEYRALLREYGALLRENRALLREHRALLRECRAVLREYGAIMKECRALLTEYQDPHLCHWYAGLLNTGQF